MKSREERFLALQASLSDLGALEITETKPTLCAPYGDDLSSYGFTPVAWAPMIWQGDLPLPEQHPLLKESRVFAIGLSSVMACLQLDVKAGDTVLDMCAAPGIKSLYLQLSHNRQLRLYVNDLSHDRLLRLRRLFDQFGIPQPAYTNQPGQTLLTKYEPGYFDAVILDAPCSGEGTIFEGDEAALSAWSPAKVKRLGQLQRKLIMTAHQLVKPSGDCVYATCTLNQTENERALKKAGITVKTTLLHAPARFTLQTGEAVRLLPSREGIGFFVAKIT